MASKAAVLSASSSLAARWRRSGFRPVRITLAPSARARRAVSSPMPALPPITTTVCPRSSGSRWMGKVVVAVLMIPPGNPAIDEPRRSRRCDLGVVVYCGSSLPACSATMYAAYQSGQFSSRWPMRFSCSPWAASARRNALARSFADAKVVTAGVDAPGKPRRDLLEQPAVAVRIAERGERAVAAMLGIRTVDPAPPKQVGLVLASVHAAGVVEHLADLDAATKQFFACGLDVGDDQVQALGGAGCRRRDVLAEDDRASGARRRELDYAEVVTVVEVGVEPPPELRVELLRAVDIRDGDDDDLELHVDFRDARVRRASLRTSSMHLPCSFLLRVHVDRMSDFSFA